MTLEEYLSDKHEVKKRNDLSYFFYIGLTPCFGVLTILPDYMELRVMPCHNIVDIGNGKGASVIVKLEREPNASISL